MAGDLIMVCFEKKRTAKMGGKHLKIHQKIRVSPICVKTIISETVEWLSKSFFYLVRLSFKFAQLELEMRD